MTEQGAWIRHLIAQRPLKLGSFEQMAGGPQRLRSVLFKWTLRFAQGLLHGGDG